MCTVTIVPHPLGFRLVTNRDERRTRAIGLPPVRRRQGALDAVFPLDPEGGGTWVGVNAGGLALALLNGDDEQGWSPKPRRSRGLIIPDLLQHQRIDELAAAVGRLDADSFRPFRVVAAQARAILVVSWDARTVAVREASLHAPVMFTSSSLGDARAEAVRRPVFRKAFGVDFRRWLDAQAAFHAWRCARRPGLGVVMTRADAYTVSRTWIDVAEKAFSIRYEALHGDGLATEAA